MVHIHEQSEERASARWWFTPELLPSSSHRGSHRDCGLSAFHSSQPSRQLPVLTDGGRRERDVDLQARPKFRATSDGRQQTVGFRGRDWR